MENFNFDWLDANYVANYKTPRLLPSDSPTVSPTAEQSDLTTRPAISAFRLADQPSSNCALPLLRLSNWDSTKLYNKDNPECIYYKFW
jgi:hypothetical protein